MSALEINPDDRNVLTKLMSVYSASKDWGRLVEVILRIADLLEEPRQLAKYYITAGSITSRELGRLDEAAGYYEQALNMMLRWRRASRLSPMLAAARDWDRLEDAYRAYLAY